MHDAMQVFLLSEYVHLKLAMDIFSNTVKSKGNWGSEMIFITEPDKTRSRMSVWTWEVILTTKYRNENYSTTYDTFYNKI